MLGKIVRKLGNLFYSYPQVPEDVACSGQFGQLKIALVADYFTADCLSVECRIRSLTPGNFKEVISEWKPDLIFVESAFHGVDGAWCFELIGQPGLRLGPKAIHSVVEFARSRGIPTVFWNKDDGAFFDAFIDVARAFDYVFTTDDETVARYRQHVPAHVPVNTLAMPFQPAFHHFTGFNFTHNEACFAGSYYRYILEERRHFLDMIFNACEQANLTLNVYDRNHDRLLRYFEFSFPKNNQLRLHPGVPYRNTAQVYKAHTISLNVNSVTRSGTMCSRRLMEILACGGIAVTNASRAVDTYFRNYCHVVSTRDDAVELFSRLKHGPFKEDMERAEAGAIYVRQNHTWAHRLEELCAIVKI